MSRARVQMGVVHKEWLSKDDQRRGGDTKDDVTASVDRKED